ncbi:MAG: redoxin domain-containing protein, partial [Halobacteriales archaeon]
MDLGFDVTGLPPADAPSEGDSLPGFTRPLSTEEGWSDVPLTEALEDGGLLVFHPMTRSFPATYVWNEVLERGWLDDVDVVGMSISTPYVQTEFVRERGGGFGLYSDPACDVGIEYGLDHALDGMEGVVEHRPAVYVVDDGLTVTYSWTAAEWPELPPYDEVE